MQRPASNDAAFIFENHKVSYVLANLRQRARQQSAIARVAGDQIVDVLRVRQNGFTRAHEPPRVETRFSFSRPESPAAPGLAPYRRQRHGSITRNPTSNSRENSHRMPDLEHATHPASDPEAHNSFPDTVSLPCQFARAPAAKERHD